MTETRYVNGCRSRSGRHPIGFRLTGASRTKAKYVSLYEAFSYYKLRTSTYIIIGGGGANDDILVQGCGPASTLPSLAVLYLAVAYVARV